MLYLKLSKKTKKQKTKTTYSTITFSFIIKFQTQLNKNYIPL